MSGYASRRDRDGLADPDDPPVRFKGFKEDLYAADHLLLLEYPALKKFRSLLMFKTGRPGHFNELF